MIEDDTPMYVNNNQMENVKGYVYLGQYYCLKDKNQENEFQNRLTAGWAAYAKHCDIVKSNFAWRDIYLTHVFCQL